MRFRERAIKAPVSTGKVEVDLQLAVYKQLNGIVSAPHPIDAPDMAFLPILSHLEPEVRYSEGIDPLDPDLPVGAIRYDAILDAATYELIELPPIVSPNYKGKKPKAVKRYKRRYLYGPKRKWAFKPVTHLSKSIERGRDVQVAISHPYKVVNNIAGGGNSGYYTFAARPTLRFKDLDILGLEPIPQDFTAEWMTKGDFKAADIPHDLNSLRRHALRDMVPDMEAGFSLPVFLGEFKDVPRMLRGFFALFKEFAFLLEDFLYQPLKTISQSHLSATFGWFPFIRDIKTIIRRLLNLRSDVEKFISEAGMRRTYHWQRHLAALDYRSEEFFYNTERYINLTGGDYPDYLWDIFNVLQLKIVEFNSVDIFDYTATLDFSYSIPDMGGWEAILASMDRFGINLSISDIWELVPFSFVVDWFFNVQSMLRGLDYTNLPVNLDLRDFCDSIKYRYTVNRQVSLASIDTTDCVHTDFLNPTSDWAVPPESASSKYIEEAYYRWQGELPLSQDDFPCFRTPNGMQLVNLVSLVTSRDHI